MSDEAEGEDAELDIEFEPEDDDAAQPFILDVPDGQVLILDGSRLAEVLGEKPAMIWATDKGVYWLTPKRRWENVEIELGPKPVRRN